MIGLYHISLLAIFCTAILVFVLLFFITAPYGKFMRKGWGLNLRSKWAWMIMELPSPVLLIYFFLSSGHKGVPQLVFLILWLAHYIHRALVYPFTQSGKNKPYPVIIVAMAIIFNILNGFVNGFGLFHVMDYKAHWLLSWQFMTGSALFASGFIMNKISDERLRELRINHPGEYVIPQKWLFDSVSCPHYLGEIIEWAGWAVMTWSLPGLAFFVFTLANLFPRAVTTHRWYREKFPEYPAGRKAVIPFII